MTTVLIYANLVCPAFLEKFDCLESLSDGLETSWESLKYVS
jgi:hypothetical protein